MRGRLWHFNSWLLLEALGSALFPLLPLRFGPLRLMLDAVHILRGLQKHSPCQVGTLGAGSFSLPSFQETLWFGFEPSFCLVMLSVPRKQANSAYAGRSSPGSRTAL